jgi:hypothetical protein
MFKFVPSSEIIVSDSFSEAELFPELHRRLSKSHPMKLEINHVKSPVENVDSPERKNAISEIKSLDLITNSNKILKK